MRSVFIIVFVLCLSPVAHAADDFGARFGDSAPPALAEDSTQNLENITPAAGDPRDKPKAMPFGPPEYLEYDPAVQGPLTQEKSKEPVSPLDQ